jgi:hypothetical protein
MLQAIKSWFSIQTNNQNLEIGSVIKTRFGRAKIIGGSVNVRLLDEKADNIIAQNGCGFTVNLKDIKN